MGFPWLQSRMFWVAVLYFSEGFPLGVFYDIFPVYFRQQGVELWKIGFMSLLGLSWTLKFLWAPLVDLYRHHRKWMLCSDLFMGGLLALFAISSGFSPWVWGVIGLFTLLSATNDIAIDGYTIEFLKKEEMGFANGIRIGFYRVGMLAAGFILIASDYLTWTGAYLLAALLLLLCGLACLRAPPEKAGAASRPFAPLTELKHLIQQPLPLCAVLLFLLGTLWLIDNAAKWSDTRPSFWTTAFLISGVLFGGLLGAGWAIKPPASPREGATLQEGVFFGTLLTMLKRPHFAIVIAFILTFKLADSAMGFMIKPFWIDTGFTATEIGLVSVNIGLLLSIAGGIVGGWVTDRVGIFSALWILGLFQAASNLGYAYAAWVLPPGGIGASLTVSHKAVIYSASAIESFTGGLGTAAFLAFLMAIVDKRHSATEYALLSSIFALSRSLAGWVSGFGAEQLGYAGYFTLTFFLAAPAYLLLPWAKKMLQYATTQKEWQQQ